MPAAQRRLAGFRMHGAVVADLNPGGEQPVQLGQVRGPGAGPLVICRPAGDLDQELVPDGAEEPLHLSPPLRPAGPRMHQLDAEHRAGTQQPRVDERAAVVDVDAFRDALAGQGRAQRGG